MAFSLSLPPVIAVLLLFALLAVLIWFWGGFLDRNEHYPGRIRAAMFVALCLVSASEIALSAQGVTRSAVVWISLLVNIWGGLDAVLRFPAAHDIESIFCVKQLFLLVVKTFAYSFGMVSFRQHVATFLAVLLINIWGMPVMYSMALPMDPSEQVVKDDTQDVDLAVRLWRLASSSHERRSCIVFCKGWWYQSLTVASECSSLARLAVCAASPEHRRVFKKMGRSV